MVIFTLLCGRPGYARIVDVATTGELIRAVENAEAGDTIIVADGAYLLRRRLLAGHTGTIDNPITLRAAHPLGAFIGVDDVIGFEVTGPSWHFDGLLLQGVCGDDTDCEHGFHVVGPAHDFRLTNSRLVDFNAHVKVNADLTHTLPERGLIENSEFFDSHPRHTDNPDAPLDIDNSIGWVIRGNLVHDFQKIGGGEEGYGIFVKGGSSAPVIERNLVECASGGPSIGRMTGISFGAHGMTPSQCPPHWSDDQPCDPEVTGGIIRNNIIGHCSGDGIYLNKATGSSILFNTLADTGGIRARYPATSGMASGNLLSGAIIVQDGGHLTDAGNIAGLANAAAVAGWPHSAAAASHAPAPGAPREDYCGRPRGPAADFGALQARLGGCALLHWAAPPARR